MRGRVVAGLTVIVFAGCSAEEQSVRRVCQDVVDPAVEDRIIGVVQDVAEHRARAIVNGTAGSAPLVLSDNTIRVSDEAAKRELRDFEVLSWWYSRTSYFQQKTRDVRVMSVSACGNKLIAEVNGTTDLTNKGGKTVSAFGPKEYEFEVAADGSWTLKEHRQLGVVKQRPAIEPEDSMYKDFDAR